MNARNKSLILTLCLPLVLAASTISDDTSTTEGTQREASDNARIHQLISRLVQTGSSFDSLQRSDLIASDRGLSLNFDDLDLNQLNAQFDDSSTKSVKKSSDSGSMSYNSWQNQLKSHGVKITRRSRRLEGGQADPYGSGYQKEITFEHTAVKGGGAKAANASAAQARNPDCACPPVFTDSPYYPFFALMGYEKGIALSVLEKTLYHLYSFMRIGDPNFDNSCTASWAKVEIGLLDYSYKPRSAPTQVDFDLFFNKDPIFFQTIKRNDQNELVVNTTTNNLTRMLVDELIPADSDESDDLDKNFVIEKKDTIFEKFQSMFRLSDTNASKANELDFNQKLLKYMIRRSRKMVQIERPNSPKAKLSLQKFADELEASNFLPFSKKRFDIEWKEIIKDKADRYGKAFLPLQLKGLDQTDNELFNICLVYTITTTTSSQGVQGYNVRAFVLDVKKLAGQKVSFVFSPSLSNSQPLRFKNDQVKLLAQRLGGRIAS